MVVGEGVVRVASFNVRNGRALDGWSSWPLRRRATVRAIAGLGADVAGLQEVFAFQLRSLRRGLPALEAVGLGRDDGRRGEHCPVLYDRTRVTLVDHVTRWFGDAPDQPGTTMAGARFPRIATTCRLFVPPLAAELVVTNTHLDAHSAARRRASVDQLLEWLDLGVPNVVVGDLNTDHDDPLLGRLAAAGLRSALPPGAGGTEHAFTGRRDGKRIDHVLVTSHLEVVSAGVTHPRPGGRLPSDHWPVVADLRLARR